MQIRLASNLQMIILTTFPVLDCRCAPSSHLIFFLFLFFVIKQCSWAGKTARWIRVLTAQVWVPSIHVKKPGVASRACMHSTRQSLEEFREEDKRQQERDCRPTCICHTYNKEYLALHTFKYFQECSLYLYNYFQAIKLFNCFNRNSRGSIPLLMTRVHRTLEIQLSWESAWLSGMKPRACPQTIQTTYGDEHLSSQYLVARKSEGFAQPGVHETLSQNLSPQGLLLVSIKTNSDKLTRLKQPAPAPLTYDTSFFCYPTFAFLLCCFSGAGLLNPGPRSTSLKVHRQQ